MRDWNELRRLYDIQVEVASDLRERLAEAVKYVEEGQSWICSEVCGRHGHNEACKRFAAFLAKEKEKGWP